jgi:hypothetical protein
MSKLDEFYGIVPSKEDHKRFCKLCLTEETRDAAGHSNMASTGDYCLACASQWQ